MFQKNYFSGIPKGLYLSEFFLNFEISVNIGKEPRFAQLESMKHEDSFPFFTF